VFARLRPDATLASAQADMSAVMKRLSRCTRRQPRRGAWVRCSGRGGGGARRALLLLFGAVGLLLLMACASVANLVLTRGVSRERELAIRTSIGAGPWRLFRQLLTESLLLACLGGAAGALLAIGLVRLVRTLGPELPRLEQASVDGRALSFALFASMLSALVFGVLPAVRGARRPPQAGLQEAGRTSGAASGLRARRSLAAFELAAAVVLVAGAGLLLRSFWKLQDVDPGFDSRGLLIAKHSLAGPGYIFPKGWQVNDWPALNAFTESLAGRLQANPAVRSAFAPGADGPRLTTRGRSRAPRPPPGEQDEASSAGERGLLRHADSAVAGRVRALDGPGGCCRRRNDAFVARHLPGEDPLGHRIRRSAPLRDRGRGADERFQGLGGPRLRHVPSWRRTR
jgi:hypothetical protein